LKRGNGKNKKPLLWRRGLYPIDNWQRAIGKRFWN